MHPLLKKNRGSAPEPLGLLLSLVTGHGKFIFIPACCSITQFRNNLEIDYNPAKSGISVDLQKLSALSHFGSQVRRLKGARTFIYVKATEKQQTAESVCATLCCFIVQNVSLVELLCATSVAIYL